MIPLNYHHLYYFWTVARLGSISAAAQELYLAQPTLSLQLKELEAALKAKLLVRGRAGVALTAEGRAIFERCARIFAEGEELASFVRSGCRAPAVLRIGLRPTVTREVILQVLSFIRTADASCRVAVISGDAEALAGKLKRGTLDLVIANRDYSAGFGKEFGGRLVAQLPVCFVANRRVRSSVKRFPADLARLPLLLRPAENPVRKQVDQYLAKRRIVCDVAADSDDADLLRRLAIDGRGAAALSALAVASDLRSGRLAALHASPTGIREPIWFICRSQPQITPALRGIIGRLVGEFALSGPRPRQGDGG